MVYLLLLSLRRNLGNKRVASTSSWTSQKLVETINASMKVHAKWNTNLVNIQTPMWQINNLLCVQGDSPFADQFWRTKCEFDVWVGGKQWFAVMHRLGQSQSVWGSHLESLQGQLVLAVARSPTREHNWGPI